MNVEFNKLIASLITLPENVDKACRFNPDVLRLKYQDLHISVLNQEGKITIISKDICVKVDTYNRAMRSIAVLLAERLKDVKL